MEINFAQKVIAKIRNEFYENVGTNNTKAGNQKEATLREKATNGY